VLTDPVERTAAYKAIIAAVNKEAEAEAAAYRARMGYCHVLWGAKQRILKEKYGIEWRTPAEMNPLTCFD